MTESPLTIRTESTKPDWRVRPAGMEDVRALTRLTAQLGYPASDTVIGTRVGRILSDPTHQLLVADALGDGVVGWIHGFLCQLIESDYRVEIGGLIVAESCRGRGIGRDLVRHLECWAAGRGALELSVRCRVERDRAHAFYEAMGFRRTKTQHTFRKRLDPPSESTAG